MRVVCGVLRVAWCMLYAAAEEELHERRMAVESELASAEVSPALGAIVRCALHRRHATLAPLGVCANCSGGWAR
jgi:hypothetical protein